MPLTIEEIKIKALPILREAGVSRSSVFGSTARGEAKDDSDIDLLVDLPKGKSLLDLAELQIQLQEALGHKVDVLTYRSISPLLLDYIQRDQVSIL